jgi:hypothetical protein
LGAQKKLWEPKQNWEPNKDWEKIKLETGKIWEPKKMGSKKNIGEQKKILGPFFFPGMFLGEHKRNCGAEIKTRAKTKLQTEKGRLGRGKLLCLS